MMGLWRRGSNGAEGNVSAIWTTKRVIGFPAGPAVLWSHNVFSFYKHLIFYYKKDGFFNKNKRIFFRKNK
jgi:hypothetical protein